MRVPCPTCKIPLREPLMPMARRKHRSGFHHAAAEAGHRLASLGRHGYGFKFACACGVVGSYRSRRNLAWLDWTDHIETEGAVNNHPPQSPPSPRKLPAGFIRAR